MKYLDERNLQLAMAEYEDLRKNRIAWTPNGTEIGTVTQVYDNERGFLGIGSGEQVYAVVANPDQNPSEVTEVTVLFRGSTGPDKTLSQPQDVWNDWVENDLVLGARILMEDHTPIKLRDDQSTMQLQASAAALKDIMETYPNAKVNIYAHSLGSMDAQYSMADLSEEDIKRIASAHIYNGPNIYTLLTPIQQNRVDSIKGRVYNYADPKDMISMVGRDQDKGSIGSVGMVFYADSKDIGFVDQHMTYGYRKDKYGNIKVFQTPSTIAYNNTLLAMASFQSVKGQLAAGGFSRTEKLYLDSLQAQSLVSGLKTAVELGQEEMVRHASLANEDLDELYASLSDVPWGFISSPDEVRSAYAAAGVDYESVVDKNQTYVKHKQDVAKAIKRRIEKLEMETQKGIEKMIQDDQELAREMVGWISMT